MFKRLKRAQSTAEYAVVIGLVVAAAVGMQIYVKRQLQGKVRDATNYTDEAAKGKYGVGQGTAAQYEPYYATSTDVVRTSKQDYTVDTSMGGSVTREYSEAEKNKTTRGGSQGVEAAPNQ